MHFILRFALLYVHFKNQENGNTSDFSISYKSNVLASRQEFIIGIYSMANMNSARCLAYPYYRSLMTAMLQFLIEGALSNCAKTMFNVCSNEEAQILGKNLSLELSESKFQFVKPPAATHLWYTIWRGTDELDKNDLFIKAEICYLKFTLGDFKKYMFLDYYFELRTSNLSKNSIAS